MGCEICAVEQVIEAVTIAKGDMTIDLWICDTCLEHGEVVKRYIRGKIEMARAS